MSKIILARHGNTFESSAAAYFVDSKIDLPLTLRGKQQAQELLTALETKNLCPEKIFCGPLQRTREYAEIISTGLGLPLPIVDSRLNELDYGDWSGLKDQEVIEKFGRSALENWTMRGQIPSNSNWRTDEVRVLAEVRALIADLLDSADDKCLLLVSSNGRLRYFLKLLAHEYQRFVVAGKLGIKTGNVAVLEADDKGLQLVAWNISPAAL